MQMKYNYYDDKQIAAVGLNRKSYNYGKIAYAATRVDNMVTNYLMKADIRYSSHSKNINNYGEKQAKIILYLHILQQQCIEKNKSLRVASLKAIALALGTSTEWVRKIIDNQMTYSSGDHKLYFKEKRTRGKSSWLINPFVKIEQLKAKAKEFWEGMSNSRKALHNYLNRNRPKEEIYSLVESNQLNDIESTDTSKEKPPSDDEWAMDF